MAVRSGVLATQIERVQLKFYKHILNLKKSTPSFMIYGELGAHTLYPGCNIFVYIADQKQPNTSRARMDCGKLTLFLLLQTLKRGVTSQDFAEKHSVPTFMFRHK